MRNVSALAMILAFVVTGCSTKSPADTVQVAQVIENIHNWNGQTVMVQGWLGECGGKDCGLFQTSADALTVANGDYQTESWSAAMNRRLSIGYDEKFDRAAFHLQFKPVWLKARISDECRQKETRCFDRATDLHPISIELDTTDRYN